MKMNVLKIKMTATKMQPVLTRLDHSHAHVTLDTLGMAKIVQVSEDSKTIPYNKLI